MKKIFYLIMALMAMGITSCENDPYLYSDPDKIYLSGDKEQGATDDSTFFSFKLYNDDVTEYTLNVKANLLGKVTGVDRKVNIIVVDSLTTAPASSYEVGEGILKAGQTVATIPVKVKRVIDSFNMSKQYVKLTLRVVANENFEEGINKRLNFSLVWCDYLLEPATWGIISYYIGKFSQARFKFIIDYTGYTSFEDFENDYSRQLSFQAQLKKLLEEYNSNPANADNPAGWPYEDDDGTPLSF